MNHLSAQTLPQQIRQSEKHSAMWSVQAQRLASRLPDCDSR
jgi:hypothetical protein